MSTSESSHERGWMWVRLVVSLLVLAGAYVGLCVWSADHAPASASVGGATVGGLSSERAREVVGAHAEQLLAAPITVTEPDGSDSFQLVPRDAGLGVDVERSVAELSGFTLDPRIVWQKLTGRVEVPFVTTHDDAALTQYVTARAAPLERPAVEGAVTFTEGRVAVVPPQPGRRTDVAATKLAVRRAFPDSRSATAVFTSVEPEVGSAGITAAAQGFGAKAMSGPVTLVEGSTRATLTPKEFGAVVRMVPDGSGGLAPSWDDDALRELLAARVQVGSQPAKNARWGFKDSRPVLEPSVDGRTVDDDALVDAVHAAVAATGAARTVTVPMVVAKPDFTTDDALKAGIKEIVADFTSPFPTNDPTRTNNLVVAARQINGTYVAPGATFSLNGILGERTAQKGYADGTVIINGTLTRGTGGGISQVSTVIYNLAYFAGAQIVEFTPHAFFIPRYPEGREATVYWPTVDNKWKNDTAHGMLVETWVEGDAVRGRIWSTKTWDIRSVKGPRRNVVPPRTIVNDTLKCYPQSPNPGFDVTVTRQFYRPGSSRLERSEDVTTHYIPEDKVVCTNPGATPP